MSTRINPTIRKAISARAAWLETDGVWNPAIPNQRGDWRTRVESDVAERTARPLGHPRSRPRSRHRPDHRARTSRLPDLNGVLARAEEPKPLATVGEEVDEFDAFDAFDAFVARLRDVSAEAERAKWEQTVMLAYGRLFITPPISFEALAKASGLSYSGVRGRLTPEVLDAVRKAAQR